MPITFKNIRIAAVFSFVFFICFICVLFFSSSCSREIKNISTETVFKDGETGILANNGAVDFYFYYPENWGIHRNDLMITVYVNDPKTLESNLTEGVSESPLAFMTVPNISAQVFSLLEGYETIDDYWIYFAAPSFRQIFDEVSDEAEDELVVDGAPAKKYTYSISLSGMDYKISQIVFLKNRRVYTITYTAISEKYDTYANVLDNAAETFKFK